MHRFVFWPFYVFLVAGPVYAQTLSPPFGHFRVKADGVLSLRNDGDAPLAALLEVKGFSVDNDLDVHYGTLDPGIQVELGANSFIIPPHQSHYVFYKASAKSLPAWFAIVNTLTLARPIQGLRVNFVLPHLVYVYQKTKLNRNDVLVRASPTVKAGEWLLELENTGQRLGRVKRIRTRGFSPPGEHGGFPLFPGETRALIVKTGTPSAQSGFQIEFEDGFRLEEKLPISAASAAVSAAPPKQ